MFNSNKQAEIRMNPPIRQKILFSLSQPTNPIPGAVLRHLDKHVESAIIKSCMQAGWIAIEQNQYVLTESGCLGLCNKVPIKHDALDFNNSDEKNEGSGIWYR